MTLKKKINETSIKRNILKWYIYNQRNLPWRVKKRNNLPNAYYIFVSEFMLQQTTVNSVIPKFKNFIQKWPNLKKLSKVKEVDILTFWAGLGYYSRAKNLLKSSKLISNNYYNMIPSDYSKLIKLPGVGEYTARAIEGIAYNKSVMPIDTNIRRIIARLYCITKPLYSQKKEINLYAEKLISKNRSSDLIQALMDYGSKICLPSVPKCNICVINRYCLSFKKRKIKEVPFKKVDSKFKSIKFTRAYIIVNQFNEILVRRRPQNGMLASMLEVPTDSWIDNKKKLVKSFKYKSLSIKLKKLSLNFIYSFSHFDLNVDIYYSNVNKINFPKSQWISLAQIDNSGMPTIMKKIVNNYNSLI